MITFWVIYFGASNHPPGKWVVRAQDAAAPLPNGMLRAGEREPGIRVHETFSECDSLEEARAKVPDRCHHMPRMEHDDPAIVEVWF